MTLDDAPRAALTRLDTFTVALFGVFTALVVLPALVFSVIAIVSPGAIDPGH